MINILSRETVDKIAAGEVIERPESVVKELLENAIDSGADSISVEIREGGLSLIRVTDNGSGIAREDIPLAFVRHATSKLQSASDLFHIRTMGFRGEALASICGVSETELITKERASMYGYRYEIDGGTEKGLQEIGAPDGTTIIVRNLFYNVPARKKFLRSPSSEGSRIADITEKTALSHPEISFRLTADGRNLLHTAGKGRLRDVIYSIYGKEVAENLIALPGENAPEGHAAHSVSEAERMDCGAKPSASGRFSKSGVSVFGYIGKPVIARAKRDFEVYFVNGRYIRSSVIENALEEAFKPYMMLHKFPFAMLRIDIDPERVDVNVHPKKMEVRFSDAEAVYDAVFSAVSSALSETELISSISPGKESPPAPSRGVGALPVAREERTEPFEEKRASLQLREAEMRKTPAPEMSREGFREDAASYGRNENSSSLRGAESAESAENGAVFSAREAAPKERQEMPSGRSEETSEKQPVFPQQKAEAAEEEKAEAVGEEIQKRLPEPGRFEQTALFQSERFLSENSFPSFRMIGQLFSTYWLIEFSDKLYIIDQHAAHEKVNYERTMRLLREKKLESQMIFPPIRIRLSEEERLLLARYMESFSELGYELELDEDRELIVRAVPSNLYSIASRELLTELLDGLCEERGRAQTPEALRERVASMSCKAAVKGNRYLSEEEMRALIGELLTLDNPYACPHGRPTIVSMSKYELDKKFKRIV